MTNIVLRAQVQRRVRLRESHRNACRGRVAPRTFDGRRWTCFRSLSYALFTIRAHPGQARPDQIRRLRCCISCRAARSLMLVSSRCAVQGWLREFHQLRLTRIHRPWSRRPLAARATAARAEIIFADIFLCRVPLPPVFLARLFDLRFALLGVRTHEIALAVRALPNQRSSRRRDPGLANS